VIATIVLGTKVQKQRDCTGIHNNRRDKKWKMESIFSKDETIWSYFVLLSVYCFGFLYLCIQFTASCHFLLVVVAETMDDFQTRIQQLNLYARVISFFIHFSICITTT